MKLFLSLVLVLSLPARASTLEQKLESQWDRYQSAQELLLSRMSKSGPLAEKLISRAEWEAVLEGQGEERITWQDRLDLRKQQRERIEAAREAAAKASLVNLDFFRRLPPGDREEKIHEFCRDVPKGGMLHIHPSGTLNRETVDRLITLNQPVIPIAEILSGIASSGGNAMLFFGETNWLEGLGEAPAYSALPLETQSALRSFLFLPPGNQPFPRFNSIFRFLDLAIQTWENFESALFDFSDRAVREGVSYVEFSDGISPELIEIFKKIEARNGLVIRVNRSFNRTATPERLEGGIRQLLQEPANPWVVGIDLLDNEEGNPALEKGQVPYGILLSEVREGRSRLHRTMHAGEIGDYRNPRDAIILGAERLGHGVNLDTDPVTLEYAARKKVAVEVNLSSNLRLTRVHSVKENPFLDYLRLGLPVSLSTDDEGIFDTDIEKECILAVSETNVTYEEMKRMAYNSLQTSFASDELKRELLKKLDGSFQKFETVWTHRFLAN